MKRGDIVIAGARGNFSGKPRSWLVVQNSIFMDEPASITVCAISSGPDAAEFRIVVVPDRDNGLRDLSVVLVDKTLTLGADAIVEAIGTLDAATMTRVDQALRLWLDL